jgi:hypothetical protein
LELRQDALQIVGRVLCVNQEPIKPRTSTDLCRDGVGQSHPKSNLNLLFFKGDFEAVDGRLHGLKL